ncbi:MAG: integration host factor subunit beta [Desulfovibrio sp.]|nr:integration host factor subunit beta [Desulfovibrio sp.]
MTKSELIKELSSKANIPVEEANDIVQTFITTMKNNLMEGNRIEIRGFGSFMVKEYKGYTGRNPKTGESVTVHAKRLPAFRAGKELKERINTQNQ